jgi:threonine aldolase
MIDLRSDTVTRPTKEMLRAMARARVGDDVFRDDPTVRELEEFAAEFLGQPAAIFMPSGTMANVAALKAWTQPGDAVIADRRSHTVRYEVGGGAVICGLMFDTVDMPDGILTSEAVRGAVRKSDVHQPITRLVQVENTHNLAGGLCYPLKRVREMRRLTKELGLVLHMDGARLANAAVARGVRASDYGRLCDSVTQCFSKGLGCPVGTVLGGPVDFIERARRARKMLGGGMRQAGYLAAAGLYALRHNVDRLAEDHAHARALAEGLATLPGIEVKPEAVETNLVFFRIKAGAERAQALVAELKARGALISLLGADLARAVTHLDVTRRDVDKALGIMRKALR